MQTVCGYTPAQIREMEIDDVERLGRYWKRHPPLHELAASYLGFEPESEPGESPVISREEFRDWVKRAQQKKNG
jgi:hypothetical protein